MSEHGRVNQQHWGWIYTMLYIYIWYIHIYVIYIWYIYIYHMCKYNIIHIYKICTQIYIHIYINIITYIYIYYIIYYIYTLYIWYIYIIYIWYMYIIYIYTCDRLDRRNRWVQWTQILIIKATIHLGQTRVFKTGMVRFVETFIQTYMLTFTLPCTLW